MTDPSIKNQLLHLVIKKALTHESPEVNLIAEGRDEDGTFHRYVFIVEAGNESGLYVLHIDMGVQTVILMRVCGEPEYQEYPFDDVSGFPFPSMN